jgi:hypothetical protein
MTVLRHPTDGGERVVAVSQQRRSRIYEYERRQLLLLTPASCSHKSEEEKECANNLKRLARSLSRSTPMQYRFWQVQLFYIIY